MKRALPFLAVLVLLLSASCRQGAGYSADESELIPPAAIALIKIHDIEQFRSEYRNNGLLQIYRDDNRQNRIFRVLDSVLSLDLGPECLVALGGGPKAVPDWLVLFRESRSVASDSTPGRDSLPQWSLPDSLGLFTDVRGAMRLISNSALLLQSTLDQDPDGTDRQALKRAFRTANKHASASLFLPPGTTNPLNSFLLGPDTGAVTTSGTSWSAFDLQLRSDAFLLQGIEVRPDSIWDNRTLLRGIPLLPLQEFTRVAPESTENFYALSLQQPERFLENQQQLLARSNPYPALLESVEQMGLIETGGETVLLLHSVNSQGVLETLRPDLTELNSFQDAPMFELGQSEILRMAFEPLLNRLPAVFFMGQAGNYFILAPTRETVENIISAHHREASYGSGDRFGALNPYLASESSALVISNNPGQGGFLTDSLSPMALPGPIANKLPDSYLYTAQLNSAEGYDLVEYQFRKKDDPSGTGTSVSTVFTRKLEGRVQAGPFLLKNHRTGGMDLAVQDDQNQLYLVSASGEIYWKKELPGPVQGNIHQVDLLKNGRYQMAFTTPDQLMVLDRDGNAVAPFPREFPGGNLGPLAVFDYEGDRNYRLVATQGARVFMFDGQGRNVSGFKFRDAGSPIIGEPTHIRIGSRDYLVFRTEDGRLRILNRVGDIRVRVADQFDFSGNGVYEYRDKFAFTDTSGNLVTIDPTGKIARAPLGLNADHGMYATARTLALMNDNLFRVKENQADLDLGVYTGPRIFYLYDIIYVAVTDIQSQQVYLFRSNADQLPGFPVEGGGLPDMADMDGDRNPELAVKFRDSSVAVYRIQR